tara:strand:+ start:1750 stop:2682 length:933 start_codon:yes stop_codon:yes gene_type:complete
MKISFLCDIKLPNYEHVPEAYEYLHGRHSATGYYYWMLKNRGIDIHLAHTREDLNHTDVVIFHYDNRDIIKDLTCKKIQVVTDRPCAEGCDVYIAANRSITTPKIDSKVVERYGIEGGMNTWIKDRDKWAFIHYPPTFGIKQCTANFPPTNFKFVGREHTLIPEILDNKFISKCKDSGINLQFDFVNDGNDGTEDVYFCVRRSSWISKASGLENNAGKYGHRTANRLYQAWYMKTPGIFNVSPEMNVLRESELDFLAANTVDEFFEQALRLKNDSDLFHNMVHNGISKSDNPYSDINIVVDQWITVLTNM